jgi:tetratricopeptide (TPR) repeat protein
MPRASRAVELCCVGLLLSVGMSARTFGQRASDLRAEAFRLHGLGLYRESLPYFDELLVRKSKDLEALNKRGTALLHLNQPERALVDFDRVIQINPRFGFDYASSGAPATAEAWTNRGIALVMLSHDDEAMLAFQRAISLRGFFVNANPAGLASDYCGVGQVYHRQGNDVRALDAFARAIRMNPADPNSHVGQGLAYEALGMRDRAQTSFGEAIRLAPNNSRAYGFRAATLERMDRIDDALSDYGQAIRSDPSAAVVHRLRGALLCRQGRYRESLADFDAAIAIDPNDAGARKDRGGVYNMMAEYARALSDLDEAVRLDPKSAKAYQNRASTYNGLGRHELAVRDCERALELDSKCAGALCNRGVALIGLDRDEEAIESLDRALRLNPALVPALVSRAEAFSRLGLIEQAAADYDEVARLDPDIARKSPTLAHIHELLIRKDNSSPGDDMALRHALTQAAVEFDRANDQRASGDWQGAIASYSRAIELDPRHADAHSLRGWSRLCLGESGAAEDARTALDRKGWRDPSAPYLALLGIFGARQEGHDAESARFLDEALANTRPPAWPSPLFRYLKRTLTTTALLAMADDPTKLTEARAIMGLDLVARGERIAGREHLRWVSEHGVERSIARDVARETLRRLESGPK